MADEKKDDKKEPKKDDNKKDSGKEKDRNMWVILEEIGLLLLGLYIFFRVLNSAKYGMDAYFMNHFDQDSVIRRFYADPSMRNLNRIAETSPTVGYIVLAFGFLKVLSYVISGALIVWIVWLYRKLSAMNAEDSIASNTPKVEAIQEDPGKKQWERILAHSQTENPSDWRLAILEADIILDEILDINGYRGETIGDKLKRVERSDMDTLDDAWEAHKIRNAIAHDGQDFVLTPREARRVVGLYENVFKEFEFI